MHILDDFLSQASSFIWGWPLIILLFGTHIYLTVRLKFIQRYIGQGIRISLRRKKEGSGDISQFGALTTSLAATIGTGNIVGVAAAVAAGGPGAVLWMWLTGVFGISTKYAEALLAVKYRVKNEAGQMSGGPMYVLERGMKMRPLGLLFAGFTAIAAFGIGNMVQANAISQLVEQTFSVKPYVTGAVLMLMTGLVILGGIRSISRTCERLVPFMAIVYVLGCLVILAINIKAIPDTVALIFTSAFSGHAAVGGFIGAGMREVIRFGVARGLFSNESGLGSAPIVAAAAQTRTPARQALVSATGTFWDTVVVCAITGIVVVSSGDWVQGLSGTELTKSAFSHIPYVGPAVLTMGLLTFVFSTILGWSYYGEKAAEYLFGTGVVRYYRYLWVAAVMVGSVATLPMVWNFADIANGLMAVPNLISLLVLAPVVVSETKKHFQEEMLMRDVPEDTFDPRFEKSAGAAETN
ncbi:MAG TPA: sodium:alanine symporter family protein [bacterium]|nr:sodium:alanine symporter family protein [bacterium]